jgi:putative glutamine amidotransferase
MDHRSDDEQPVDVQYGPAHSVRVLPGGLLEKLLGESEFRVNSLHGQGVKRLAESLRAEAVAPDGVTEAFTAPGAPGFNLGVQWHPEWQARDNPVSMKLLRAFGDACRAYREVNRETARERPRVP